jgi:hypothetical protein
VGSARLTCGRPANRSTSPQVNPKREDVTEKLQVREYEVTSGGRVRYAIDDGNRTVWLIYASPRHPEDTDR